MIDHSAKNFEVDDNLINFVWRRVNFHFGHDLDTESYKQQRGPEKKPKSLPPWMEYWVFGPKDDSSIFRTAAWPRTRV